MILQQHGPLEVTDSRLLSAFMSMSPWMRQGIKYLGGLKDFFRQGSIFNVKDDVVSLAWQEGDKVRLVMFLAFEDYSLTPNEILVVN